MALFMTNDEWISLIHDLDIHDEYGTFISANGSIKGNMAQFAKDVRNFPLK